MCTCGIPQLLPLEIANITLPLITEVGQLTKLIAKQIVQLAQGLRNYTASSRFFISTCAPIICRVHVLTIITIGLSHCSKITS